MGGKGGKKKMKEMLIIKKSVIFNSHVIFTTLNFLVFQRVGLTFDPLYQKSLSQMRKNQREERGTGSRAKLAGFAACGCT